MGYRVAAGGTSHVFADLRELMAKATPPRSGDQLAGLAAGSMQEMMAARIALADLPLRMPGLALGANWNEVHAGTNGIGTCIAEKTTLTCHRDDHFYIGHVGMGRHPAIASHILAEIIGIT